nr:DUF4339 domain-containing protein [uncultured Carboxylicivirga sp.]
MNKKWYYVENGIKLGPFSIEELKGKINLETLLWTEGMPDWAKAESLKDFEHFFTVTPPPIPDNESVINERSKHLKRIGDSVFYGWALLGLTLLQGILDFTEYNKSRFYSLVVFLSLTSLIRVFRGVKSYLSNLLNFKQANRNIYWMIGTSIPIYLFDALDSRYNIETRFSEEIVTVIYTICGVSVLLFAFHSLKLAVKLFKVEDTAISAIKTYAFLQILSFGFFLGAAFFVKSENTSIIIGVLVELIPLYFLVIGLKKVRNKYVPNRLI